MKRLLSLLLVLVLAMSFSTVVFAGDGLTIQINANGNPGYVVDHGELLTNSEEAELARLAEEISRRQGCDVVILTENGLGSKSAMEYADDYFAYNGYGVGDDRSGILLLLSMAERDWWVSTRGNAIQAFTDEGIQYLWSKCGSRFTDGDYAKGFRSYLDTANTMLSAYNGTLSEAELEAYQNDFNEFTGNIPRQKPGVAKTTIISLIIGFLISFLFSGGLRSQLKSVRTQYSASNYRRPDSMYLNRNRDVYLYANVTSHVIETQRTSSGGGSTTHISSSGATHGGGGGKF